MSSGECAPTLAPWKPIHEVTTSEATIPHDKHIYDINDIVNFEDNDIVMRDPSVKFHDNNKFDNSVDPLNEIQKLNMAEFKEGKVITNDLSNVKNLKPDPVKEIQKINMANLNKASDFNNNAIMADGFGKIKQNADDNIKLKSNDVKNNLMNDIAVNDAKVDLKVYDEVKITHNDVITDDLKDKDDVCECQHGGGCVNHVCLCPLGYAGDKCEITLDLKVRIELFLAYLKFEKGTIKRNLYSVV